MWMNMSCPQAPQRPLVPAHVRAVLCKSLLSTFSTKNNVRFLHREPKYSNPPGPRPCEAAPQELRFWRRPTTTNHTGVPESTALEHDEASERWQHWRKLSAKSTRCEVAEVKSKLRPETSSRSLVRTRGCVMSFLGPNFLSST